jgi:hypothetical protein
MIADLRRILGALRAEDSFLLLDTRVPPVELYLHHWRPWLRGGVTSRLIMTVDEPQSSPVISKLADFPEVSVAILVRAGDQDWGLFAECVVAGINTGQRAVQIVDQEGRWLIEASPVSEFPFIDKTRSTKLSVTGRSGRDVRDEDFPMVIEFRLDDPNGPNNLLSLKASSSHESERLRLPEPLWLRLTSTGVGQGEIQVSIDPRAGGDEWVLKSPSDLVAERVPMPLPTTADDRLSRVAIVFDRTCPDGAHWSDCLDLAKERAGDNPPYGDYNSEIRKALAKALREYPWPAGSQGLVSWFADSAGQEVAGLKGVTTPGKAWGHRGPVELAGSNIDSWVADLTYSPGLDVWDRLEEALYDTQRLFEGGTGGTVLIVGNSPPSYPTRKSPLSEVGVVRGVSTAWRYQSNRWDLALSELARVGVNVYYLFLRVPGGKAEQAHEFALFDELQSKVEEALRKCLPGRVISTLSDAVGVEQGVRQALSLARDTPRPVSGVEVLSVKTA